MVLACTACTAPTTNAGNVTSAASASGYYPVDVESITAVDGERIPGVDVGRRESLHVKGSFTTRFLVFDVPNSVDEDAAILTPVVATHGPNGVECTKDADCQADLVRSGDDLVLSVTSYHDLANHSFEVLTPNRRYPIVVGTIAPDGTVALNDKVQLDVSYYIKPIDLDIFDTTKNGLRLSFTIL
jgi:hypothetical protein